MPVKPHKARPGNRDDGLPAFNRRLVGLNRLVLRAKAIPMKRSELPEKDRDEGKDWWNFCPVCGAQMVNHECRFVCPKPECLFFMSCTEFDS